MSRRSAIRAACRLAVAMAGIVPAFAAESDRLGDLSVEQLLDLKVTSVARREESVSRSPAAIYVITQDEIRRSGARSIFEALRLAPGLNVAQVDAHTSAVSARGFNDVFANKLLVLIDGRSVYTPLFSGVYWEVQDVVIEDIDRIEVIRGPGAALWGANAVNGVINITTKNAAQTQGGLLTMGGGNEERAFTTFRFGGALSDELHYRVFAKGFLRDDAARLNGGDANDGWRMGHTGFRLDWTPAENVFTLQGSVYRVFEDSYYTRLRSRAPFAAYEEFSVNQNSGGNLLGRWTRELSGGGQLSVQTYYDRTNSDSPIFTERRDTFDIDLQHRFSWGERQTFVWGGGYRFGTDEIENNFDISAFPTSRSTNLFNAFLQDEIALVKERLVLTLGSKLEHNDFTGFELQPSARLLWTPTARQSAWASVSRAVRTPSRAESDLRIRRGPVIPPNALYPTSPAVLTELSGNADFESEEVIATEFGCRIEATERLSFDLALFYNEYSGVRVFDAGEPLIDLFADPAHINATAKNGLDAETYGGEIAANWQATPWWKWRANYSLLYMNAHVATAGAVPDELRAEGSSARHQAAVRSSIDLPHGFEFDAGLRYVDALPALQVPSYIALDLRIGWQISDNVEVSVVGRNLLDRGHTEFKPTTIGSEATEVERSIYGSVTIRF
ncbi:MAG: TonB-dependent receptor [Chthoniobacteraceae bacterium]